MSVRERKTGKVITFEQPGHSPAFSDDALALRFAECHADELRYVAKWSQWLSWNGVRWQFDDTLTVFDRTRVICRAAGAECNKMKAAKELTSAKTVAAVERLARSDRRLAATAADGGSSRSSAISRKISWIICRGIATSAIWNTM